MNEHDSEHEPEDTSGEDAVRHDASVDQQIESMADGHEALGERESSGTLAFAVPAREQFDALDDPPVTGDARVDAASARLVELADLPTPDHVEVYDDVHRRLQDALADADVR